MPVPPTPDHDPALFLLLLLAREAGLAPDQVDGPGSRALVRRGLGIRARRHRASGPGRRPWTCPHRWTAA